jgi:hypothetical protein
MRERDRTRQLIDDAVVEKAQDLREEENQELAVLFNNAIVKAFSTKKG